MLTQRDKWLVFGLGIKTLKGGMRSYEVTQDIVPAPTKEEALERTFDARSKEYPEFILQDAELLIDTMWTQRKLYDEKVEVTEHRFATRTQC